MAKEAPPASLSSQNTARTLYVDTNLDTHFVMTATEEDTIGELKQKISFAHHCCFPQTGEITVRSLKVKRSGCFYHLLDTMLVKHVFEGVTRRWILHVEAALKELPLYLEPAANTQVGKIEDASEKEMVSGGAQTKKRKRRHAADVNKGGVQFSDSSVVVKSEIPQKKRKKKSKKGVDADSKTQLHANDAEDTSKCEQIFNGDGHAVEVHNKTSLEVCCGADEVGTAENDMVEVDKVLLQNDDPKMIPETTDTMLMMKELGVPTKSVDAAGNMEAQDTPDTRKKMVKKIKNSGGKNNVSAAQLENVDGAGDTLLVQGHPRVEPQKGAAILSETEGVNVSKMESVNTPAEGYVNHDYQGSGREDTSPKKSKIVSVQETTENIDDKVKSKSVKPPSSTSYTFTDQGMKQQVEAQDPSDTRKKKGKKTKNSNAKNNMSSSGVVHVEGAGVALLVQNHPGVEPEKGDTILSDTEGVKALNLERLTTQAEGSVNNDYQGSGHKDTSPEKAKIVRAQETTENIDDRVNWESVQPPSFTSYTFTDQGIKQQVEAQGPYIRKKRAKKTKKSNAQNNVPASQLENVKGAGDVSLVQDHPGVEPQHGDTILSETEGVNASKVESLNTPAEGYVNHDYQGSGREDTSPKKSEIVRVQETAENIDDKVKSGSVKLPSSTSNTVTDQGMKQQVEAQGPSGIRKKRAKKTKNSNAQNNVSASQLENVKGAGDASLVQDHPGVEPRNGDTILSETEGVNASKAECLNTPAEGSVNNDYQGSGLDDISTQKAEIIRIQETTDNIDDKVTRKPVKPPPSTSNNVTNPEFKHQVDITEDLSLSTKGNEEGEKATPKKRKSKTKKDSSAKQSVDITPDAEHNDDFRTDSFFLSQLANNVESRQTSSNAFNHSVGGQHHVSGRVDESTDNKEVPKSDDDKVDLGDHFMPRNDDDELVTPGKKLVEKGYHQRKHDKELKGNKKTKMHNVDPTIITSDLENPQESVDNQVLGTRTQRGSSEISKLQKMKTKPNSSEKAPVSAGAVHSSSKIPIVAARKPYSKKTGEVGSQIGKNLLAASDTIFAQSSSESSADSDATMSPLDTASSSDQSEGEGVNSPRKGSYGRKTAENGGNNSIKPQNTLRKNMDLDAILRSSRSYKKAKLTASQSQLDDTESEAIQFDLDTQL